MSIQLRKLANNMYDSIIFDLDGTLWDSTEEIAVLINKVLNEKYPEIKDKVNAQILKSLFGRPMDEIAVNVFKSISQERAINITDEIYGYQNQYLGEKGAVLFPGLEETLDKLFGNYKLFIVSNCGEGYIQSFFKAYPHLEKYFIDFEYPGRTGKYKSDNISMVIERNYLERPVYVGDTEGDAKACKEVGIPFIYARYGFGHVEEKDYLGAIDSLGELIDIIK